MKKVLLIISVVMAVAAVGYYSYAQPPQGLPPQAQAARSGVISTGWSANGCPQDPPPPGGYCTWYELAILNPNQADPATISVKVYGFFNGQAPPPSFIGQVVNTPNLILDSGPINVPPGGAYTLHSNEFWSVIPTFVPGIIYVGRVDVQYTTNGALPLYGQYRWNEEVIDGATLRDTHWLLGGLAPQSM